MFSETDISTLRAALEELRPSTLDVDRDNGVDHLIWNGESYSLHAFEPHRRAFTVSESASLLELVGLDTAKLGAKFVEPGVVTFDMKGATFAPGDAGNGDRIGAPRVVHTYVRRPSPQWATLAGALDKKFEHVAFLRLLQRLKPSIDGYPALYAAFGRVSFTKDVKVDSAPQILQGNAGSQISMRLGMKGGAADVSLPAEFRVSMPLTRFGDSLEFEVMIDAALDDYGKIAFQLVSPGMAVAEEHAIAAEVAQFDAAARAKKLAVTVLVNL